MCHLTMDKLRSHVRPLTQWPFLTIGGITTLGALLRLYHLGYKSLWYDEAVLFWIAHGHFGEVIAQNAANNSAPPLFALLLNLLTRIGESEAILRSLSCLAGVIAIPAMYWLARQFLSKDTAYFCAFLVAIAASQIKYSQQLREYSIAFFLATFILAAFQRYMHAPSWHSWLVFTLTGVLGIFTQYGLSLLLLALDLIFALKWVSRTERTPLLRWVAAQCVFLCAAVVVYQVALKHQLMPSGFGANVHLAEAYWNGSLHSLVTLAADHTYALLNFAYPAQSLLLFFFLVGLLVAYGTPSGQTAILMFALPTACTFATACMRLYPYNGSRQNIFLTPMVYVFVGYAFELLYRLDAKRVLALVSVLVFTLVGLRSTVPYLVSSGDENMRPIMITLASALEPGDRIYIYHEAIPAFRYYYSQYCCKSNAAALVYGIPPVGHSDEHLWQLDDMLSRPGRVWLVFTRCQLPWLPGNECERIIEYAVRLRQVKLITSSTGMWLYSAN